MKKSTATGTMQFMLRIRIQAITNPLLFLNSIPHILPHRLENIIRTILEGMPTADLALLAHIPVLRFNRPSMAIFHYLSRLRYSLTVQGLRLQRNEICGQCQPSRCFMDLFLQHILCPGRYSQRPRNLGSICYH